jgi:hypothetical protein
MRNHGEPTTTKTRTGRRRTGPRIGAATAIAATILGATSVLAAPAQAYHCAQGPAVWTDRTGALACFKPNGDAWQAKDTASDGDSAIAWVVANGSSSGYELVNSSGYKTWAADNIYNLPEGGSYWLIACTEDFSAGGSKYCTRSAYTFANNNSLAADRDLGGTSV